MSQTPITITYSLEEVLKRIEDKMDSNQKELNQKIDKLEQKIDSNQKEINQKFDSNQKETNQKFEKIDERLTNIEVGLATLTEKVEGMDNRLEKVEGTKKNQVWALIVLLAGAIATAGARVFFTGNP